MGMKFTVASCFYYNTINIAIVTGILVCCDEQRHSRGSISPTVALRFRVEDRIECLQSHRVKYNYRDDYELALPIPLDAATNKGLFTLCTDVHWCLMHS